ncbi:hypothetical protein F2Q68_00039780 [Brassica cretica]|uniref:Uncharacterized protein n=1 Tax=Brassica cretica TaxID=69181 RepID=A0A8S9MRN0_BRACR|nr:hypothetical protein F2Q68_00039780 [Brassica cretica]
MCYGIRIEIGTNGERQSSTIDNDLTTREEWMLVYVTRSRFHLGSEEHKAVGVDLLPFANICLLTSFRQLDMCFSLTGPPPSSSCRISIGCFGGWPQSLVLLAKIVAKTPSCLLLVGLGGRDTSCLPCTTKTLP